MSQTLQERAVKLLSIRKVNSGSKTIASTVSKFLQIDSGINGAEILSVTIKGIVGADWTMKVYVPAEDAIATLVAGDLRFTNKYISTDTQGGFLQSFTIPYNCFINFTNDSLAEDSVDEVVVTYRSVGTLVLNWEV